MKKTLKNNYKEIYQEAVSLSFAHSDEFEIGMRLILGKKAYCSADLAASSKEAKYLLQKSLNELLHRIDEIITMDSRLRDMLYTNFDTLKEQVKYIDKTACRIHIIGKLFEIIGRLLGYDWLDGKKYRTPIYYRTKWQEFSDYRKMTGKDWDQIQQEENDLIVKRGEICLALRKQGLHINQIARFFNITESEVRQNLNDICLAEYAKLLKRGYSPDDIMLKLRDKYPRSLIAIVSSLSDRRATARKRLEGSI